MNLSTETKQLIDKLYKGHDHMEVTLGYWRDGERETLHLGTDGKPVEGKSPNYAVGSIVKTFNTALLAKYVAEGKLELDAPLSKYIPSLPEKYYPSLERLATHSSGYSTEPYSFLGALKMVMKINGPDGLLSNNPYHGVMDEKRMLETLAQKALKNQVYKYNYSNFGMGVLGYILGQVTGQSYWDCMHTYIREELGLPTAHLGHDADIVGYDKKNGACSCWQWSPEDVVAAAGALIAPMEELLDYAGQHLDGSKPYLELCHERRGAGEKGGDIGLAWQIRKGTNISFHGGAAGAYSAVLAMDRDKKTAVAVACNYGLVNVQDIGFSMLEHDVQ